MSSRFAPAVVVCTCLVAAAFGCAPEPHGTSSNDEVSGVSGSVEFVDRPVSVVPDENESLQIRVFQERGDYTLPDDLELEATDAQTYDDSSSKSPDTIDEGQSVDVFYVHADTDDGGETEMDGTLTFSRSISGIIYTEDGMSDANEPLRTSELTTEYPPSDNDSFGVRLSEDQFTIGPNKREVTLDFATWGSSDSLRIVLEN